MRLYCNNFVTGETAMAIDTFWFTVRELPVHVSNQMTWAEKCRWADTIYDMYYKSADTLGGELVASVGETAYKSLIEQVFGSATGRTFIAVTAISAIGGL